MNCDVSSNDKNNIILPIKPVFSEEILSGLKKYEYRKKLCKKEIKKIYIYSTAPVKLIVGEAEVVEKLSMDKEKLWDETKQYSGISKKFYDKYFSTQDYACAYKIGNVIKYEIPIPLSSVGIDYIPQSFVYVDEIIY